MLSRIVFVNACVLYERNQTPPVDALDWQIAWRAVGAVQAGQTFGFDNPKGLFRELCSSTIIAVVQGQSRRLHHSGNVVCGRNQECAYDR